MEHHYAIDPLSSSREACIALDAADPLAHLRNRFLIPEGTIYLDGNSLGALPKETPSRIANVVEQEWGRGLIRSWNTAGWVSQPRQLGDQIAPLLGAQAGEVIVTDSTSVNLFKLMCAALSVPEVFENAARRVILSEEGNFPTDLYIAQGISALLGNRFELRLVPAAEISASIDDSVALVALTHVDYRSGRMHDMAATNAVAAAQGVPILWDLSHSAGAVPLALNRDGALLAVGCGYKYLNGGPGAPAFCYIHRSLLGKLRSPLSGWFAHAKPFDFSTQFTPANGVEQFLCGTPPILSLAALESGIATFRDVSLDALRAKSLALTKLFASLVERLPTHGELPLTNITPMFPDSARGSHISLACEHGYAVMQALIARGVIGDFRAPNLMRFGFTPLYSRFVDCWDAVDHLSQVIIEREFARDQFHRRGAVT